MNSKVANYLAMIGVAFVGIGNMVYSTKDDVFEIQRNVIMDMNDIMDVEREIERRRELNEKELQYKGYTFILKD